MSRQFMLAVIAFVFSTVSVAAQDGMDNGSTSNEMAKGVYLLSGLSCNIIAVTGSNGVLIVDNGSANDSERLEKLITELGAGRAQIVINTHFHYDHIGGNKALAKQGAVIISHENGRSRMQEEWRFPESLGLRLPPVPTYPEDALPWMMATNELTMHFGGQLVEVLHLPNAHSDADLVVYLRHANVLHTGDLYLSNGFPVTDSFHGGTLDGTITAIGELIDLIDDDTKVVPGHGPISTLQELQMFRQMIVISRDRIAALIADGQTLDEVIAAKPTAGLYVRGKSWISEESFTRLAYADLARSSVPVTIKDSGLIN